MNCKLEVNIKSNKKDRLDKDKTLTCVLQVENGNRYSILEPLNHKQVSSSRINLVKLNLHKSLDTIIDKFINDNYKDIMLEEFNSKQK